MDRPSHENNRKPGKNMNASNMNWPRSPRRLPSQELLLQLYDRTKFGGTTVDGTSVAYSLKIYTASIQILLMTVFYFYLFKLQMGFCPVAVILQ
jgi:hypothetical protein